MKYTIGLDLGTSSVKGVLCDGKDAIKVVNKKFFYKTCAHKDGSEYIGFDADEFCDTVFSAIKELALEVDGNISGIAMASASGNTLICDENGKPLLPVYSWTNGQFISECDQVFKGYDYKGIVDSCGWRFGYTFPLAHLSHIKVHAPELMKKAHTVCMSTEYLLYKLTGKWGIDGSTATPFFLADQRTGKWFKPLLNVLGIEEKMLPTLGKTGDFLGTTLKETEEKTGIKAGAKVFLGSFDHPSGARANGIEKKGDMLLSCGTSWVGFFLHEDRDFILNSGFMSDPYKKDEGLWGAMFSFCQISQSIDKILKKVCKGDVVKEFNDYSAQSVKGANGLRINPVEDEDKDFSSCDKKDVCRALMEGAAYLVKERLEELDKIGVKTERIVMAGGPSQSILWKDIIQDILGIKIEIKYGVNSGAMGAALLAFNNLK